ncbi:sensor domain-containing diguanylate cyclase [Maridesulfovibrio hydrothermalis]|uniref:diguanylate cyclase n=1 Tax=Maridesulfovibrio hydrothermalis AM13 = DSM 14728 TaxID=1121451 RepID=L0RG65_9BACT|nr:sensor domain-containing diguanylate cyclase [Maridesulfovibrio hydrothermalis]CCO25205.1 Diguanylate cyclase with PAS/PAC sensor [Maridesulfovibrio hydrothermalis AM13 = DSM 14728]
MNTIPTEESISTEYKILKKKYEKLKKKILTKCPECGQTKFKELFNSAASAIAVLDKDGNALLTNSVFHEITGYSQDEISDNPLYKILMPEQDIEGQDYLKKLFCKSRRSISLSISILDKNNNHKFIDMSFACIPSKKSCPRSSICIFNDVTSERENELRREELIEELMEAKELQEDNAAQLSILLHELDMKNLELEQEINERRKAEKQLKESEERFKSLSITDQLTGLFNRRHMLEVAEKEAMNSYELKQPLSFILMDIDDFKKYNDTYGHAAGDVVLENIGSLIRKSLRETDRAFRYGGEEFLIILPKTDGVDAAQVAENIRAAVEAQKYYPKNNDPVRTTMSIGVSQYLHGESLEKVLKRADDNMYKSKIRGKNKVYFSCETGSGISS